MAKTKLPMFTKNVKITPEEKTFLIRYLAARIAEIDVTIEKLRKRYERSGVESYLNQAEGLTPVRSWLMQMIKRDDGKITFDAICYGLMEAKLDRPLAKFLDTYTKE